MADAPRTSDLPDIPEAVAAPKSGRTVQLVWLIPLVAALIGGWLAVKTILDQGPTITIRFKTAEGLEAGKTKVKFKDVEFGLVKAIALSEDRKSVIATAELIKGAEKALVEDTRFWVARARIAGGSVSGLGTLLSGAYIGVDIGKSTAKRRDYVGLDAPPAITSDVPGRQFVLKSPDLGSLDVGSPVFFRRLPVGQVASYELDPDGNGVTFRIFINEPYDKYATANARFWNASGVDITLDAGGFKVESQSLTSILIGGIAFETPPGAAAVPAAEPNATFTLFASRGEAMKNPEREVLRAIMVFDESVRGLSVGAPLDFRGIVIGQVAAINLDIDPVSRQIVVPVFVDIYPERLTARVLKSKSREATQKLLALGAATGPMQSLRGMVARGLRAQLRSGNLVTGQRYVAIEFFPDAPKVNFDVSKSPLEFPTTPTNLRELQAIIAGLAQKFEKMSLEGIGADLQETLQSATKLIRRLDTELTPETTAAMVEARKALAGADRALSGESYLQQEARDAMREVARAAQAFRVLADYLERHPEALISGKKEEQK